MRHHALTTDRDWVSKYYRALRLAAGCGLTLLLAACGGSVGIVECRSSHWSQLRSTLSHNLFQPNLGRVTLLVTLCGQL